MKMGNRSPMYGLLHRGLSRSLTVNRGLRFLRLNDNLAPISGLSYTSEKRVLGSLPIVQNGSHYLLRRRIFAARRNRNTRTSTTTSTWRSPRSRPLPRRTRGSPTPSPRSGSTSYRTQTTRSGTTKGGRKEGQTRMVPGEYYIGWVILHPVCLWPVG